MSECTHDCSSCGENCSSRTESFKEPQNKHSDIKKVIGIVSGKGGVGKSSVTSQLAVLTSRHGYNTAIVDADITGPSIPKAFGIKEKAYGTEDGILTVKTKTGISVMSINLLLENDTDPVVWRGPVIAGTVKQFWTDVIWGDVDFMFVDMPPGTGDVPLTVFQSLPLDGIIVVTSPQDLVSMIVEKALNMATVRTNLFRISMLMMTLMMAFPGVFASGPQGHSTDVIKAILSIVYLIMNVVGILFVLIGFVKLIISHAQEDAPGQQKAAMFIATGLVLIIARFVIAGLNIQNWVETTVVT